MKRVSFTIAFIATVLFSVSAQVHLSRPAAAQQSTALAQGFNTGDDTASLVTGALVSTRSGAGDDIELASSQNAARLVGVIGEKPPLTIADGQNQATVVLGGKTQALVSDINGAVKAGDRITVSPVSGVGMRASADGQVFGVAQADQPAASQTTRQTISDTQGRPHDIHINTVPIQVGVASYQTPGSNYLPPGVQRLADSIAGKRVSFFRVLLSGIMLVTAICGAFILLHTAARTGVISIGRNPIAAGAIHKGMRQVSLLAAAILIAGLAASYLLLRL